VIPPPAGYADWLGDIKTQIHEAQQRAAQALNLHLVSLYWKIGRAILDQHDFDRSPDPHHDADVRTTINISDGILSELHERARQRRRPFREILEETLQRGLSASPPSSVKQVSIQTHHLGIKPAYQGVSMNQLYDQIEAEDAVKR